MARNSLNESRLSGVAIECIDRVRLFLRCKGCGETWSPNLQPGGKLPRRWWRCPNGCNSHIRNIDRPEETDK